jgi:type II secretory pathway pseudopilin PulG
MTQDRLDPLHISNRKSRWLRPAFSLLEVVIATAVLAGSAMVLFSLLSLGSKFGAIAQQRTLALATAASVLEELIATNRIDPATTEMTGVTGGLQPLGYRLRVTPFRAATQTTDSLASLQQITVEIFPADAGSERTEQRPLCSLTRIIRSKIKENDSTRLDNSPLRGPFNGS